VQGEIELDVPGRDFLALSFGLGELAIIKVSRGCNNHGLTSGQTLNITFNQIDTGDTVDAGGTVNGRFRCELGIGPASRMSKMHRLR
jgi:hypothetical protein